MTDHGPTCSVDKSTAARPTAVRRSVPGVRKLAVFALLISGALPGQRGFHVEPDLGLRIKVPAKWERYPGEKDRRFERGYYVSNKTYPVRGMRGGHRPTLRVLVLPKAGAAAAAAQQAVTPQASVPYYIDYRDYLCRNLSGALTWDKTEQVEVAGQPCKRFQVQCRDADQAYALTTWVLELRGHLVAVECMVHRQHVDKVTPLFEAALRSCRVTEPRPATADPSGGPAIDPFELPPWLVDPAAWRALPLRQRQERRAGFAERFMAEAKAAAKAAADSGWRVKLSPHFLVVSKAPARATAEISQVAEASRAWCEAHLDAASGEVVLPAVIRVFESRGEHWRYRVRSARRSPFVPEIREVVILAPRSTAREVAALRELHEGLLHQFLHDKDVDLHRNTPAWLREGVYQYLRQSRLLGGKLEFVVDAIEQELIRDGARAGSLREARQLIEPAVEESDPAPDAPAAPVAPAAPDADWQLRFQRGRLVRFMLQKQSPFAPGFLAEYLVAVRAAQSTAGLAAANPGAGVVPGRTQAQRQALAQAERKLRAQLAALVNKAVCRWGDAGWQRIETGYLKFNRR